MSDDDVERIWGAAARELPWLRPFDRVHEPGGAPGRWFVGGRLNLCHAALDAPIGAGRADHPALVYRNERGERIAFTYAELLAEVERVAAALRGMGVGRGDRVTIVMPICPQAIQLMLATTRIGAIHSVAFAGLGERALAHRIRASGSRLVVGADVTYRRGKAVPLKGILDAALADAGDAVEACAVLQREPGTATLARGRDLDWADFLARGEGHGGGYVETEASDPAFLLGAAGSGARPKLVVHAHGGYAVGVHAMGRWAYGLTPEDVWWATSDIGWIVGHSYMTYGPLMTGCTTVVHEGAVDHPDPGALWRVVEEERVTGLFASPTGVRLLRGYGDDPPARHDLSSLERVFCAGEHLDVPAWEWLEHTVLRDRIPVIDNWWQTETGAPVIGNPYGLGLREIRPGSAGVALPGAGLAVVDEGGAEVPPGEHGLLVLTRPMPSLTPALWGEPDRYAEDYLDPVPGAWFTGDAGRIDEDGYVWLAGRADEIITTAAHRIGTVEVEAALETHPGVAEAGVTVRPDELRGETVAAFVVTRPGVEAGDALREELVAAVRRELGPLVAIGEIRFLDELPRAGDGALMRRVLKALVLDRDPERITTTERAGTPQEARAAWAALRSEAGSRSPS